MARAMTAAAQEAEEIKRAATDSMVRERGRAAAAMVTIKRQSEEAQTGKSVCDQHQPTTAKGPPADAQATTHDSLPHMY